MSPPSGIVLNGSWLAQVHDRGVELDGVPERDPVVPVGLRELALGDPLVEGADGDVEIGGLARARQRPIRSMLGELIQTELRELRQWQPRRLSKPLKAACE